MPFSCNIDSKGRTIRLIAGALTESAGLLLLVLRWQGVLSGEWPWFAGAGLAAGGLFMVLEGVFGWCAVRACGVKTPI